MLAAIGRSGFATRKREGDGATPRCRMTPLAALTRRAGALPLPSRRVRSTDGWGDDPASGQYNRPVRLPAPGSHERMMRGDALYDFVVVTDHNQRPRVRGRGSAIFVHVARPGLASTEGCLAFDIAAWRRAIVPLGPYLMGMDPRPIR